MIRWLHLLWALVRPFLAPDPSRNRLARRGWIAPAVGSTPPNRRLC